LTVFSLTNSFVAISYTHSRGDKAQYFELAFCDSEVALFGVVREERPRGRNRDLFDDNGFFFFVSLRPARRQQRRTPGQPNLRNLKGMLNYQEPVLKKLQRRN